MSNVDDCCFNTIVIIDNCRVNFNCNRCQLLKMTLQQLHITTIYIPSIATLPTRLDRLFLLLIPAISVMYVCLSISTHLIGFIGSLMMFFRIRKMNMATGRFDNILCIPSTSADDMCMFIEWNTEF